MAKQTLALVFFCLAIAIQLGHSTTEEPKEIDEWFQKLPFAKQKVTKLHFFFHDLTLGPNPTAVIVAQAPTTAKSPFRFGKINVIDDPLTVGPDPASKLVGRGQGLYASASQSEFALLCGMNFIFTEGKFNGSSLTVLGWNPTARPLRELSIVGGSGVFRLARGTVLLKTQFYDPAQLKAIIECNVLAIHY